MDLESEYDYFKRNYGVNIVTNPMEAYQHLFMESIGAKAEYYKRLHNLLNNDDIDYGDKLEMLWSTMSTNDDLLMIDNDIERLHRMITQILRLELKNIDITTFNNVRRR